MTSTSRLGQSSTDHEGTVQAGRQSSTNNVSVLVSHLPPRIRELLPPRHGWTATQQLANERTRSFTRPMFACICVVIDVSKHLPSRVWIDCSKENGFWQKVDYEGNLSFCSRCRLIGRNQATYQKSQVHPVKEAAIATVSIPKYVAQHLPLPANKGNDKGKGIWIPVSRKNSSIGDESQKFSLSQITQDLQGTIAITSNIKEIFGMKGVTTGKYVNINPEEEYQSYTRH
ncbi:unnamed protein product [Dovyalis caffra]|uniref:Uncharacterized protein n=1 Tax=Dovyalis caffra TaxID=77055 RepID=A0AAV1R6C9_9ROSI|nr:unnamed protein product [Dovyalis caffra]